MHDIWQKQLDYFLTVTQKIWPEFKNARIFITGGTGFIGYWLLESFAYANKQLNLQAHITVLSRNPELFLSKYPHFKLNNNIHWLTGDIQEFDFPKDQFTHIIHGATCSDTLTNIADSLEIFDTLVIGARRVLELARVSKASKLLLLSSGAVYGTQPPSLSNTPESFLGGANTCNSLLSYAHGKRSAEFLSVLYAKQYEIDIKIARCFTFVGPLLPLNTNYAIGNFIRDALQGGPIIIEGDGLNYRSYQYVIDLVVWLWHILARGKSAYPYNVGSDEAISIYLLAKTVVQCFSNALEIVIKNPKKNKNNELPSRYVPSVTRATQELQLKNHYNLTQGILSTVEWVQQNKERVHDLC